MCKLKYSNMKIKFYDNYLRNIFKIMSKSYGLVICLEVYVLKI